MLQLHHVGEPISKAISPVTYMWRPFCLRDGDNGAAGVADQPKRMERPTDFRQLWVWIHASSFTEGYDALKFACQKEVM